MRLLNGIYKLTNFFELLKYDILFGHKFTHGKISFRKRMNILVEDGGRLIIGDGCFFNNDCSINCMSKITIGENSIFGEGVKIYDHNYHINSGEVIKQSGHTYGEVVIGDNCWIGSNVVLLKGTHIGNNAVIGAGCVISSDICDNAIVRCSDELQISIRSPK